MRGLSHLLPLGASPPQTLEEVGADPAVGRLTAAQRERHIRLRARSLRPAEWHARILTDAVREYAAASGRGEKDVAAELDERLRRAGASARHDKNCGRALECLWLLGQAG